MNFSTQVISRRTIPQKGNPGTSRDRKLSNMEFFSPETHTIGTVISESRGADTVISDLNFQTPRAVDNPQETLQTNTDSIASGKTVNSVAILHIPYDFLVYQEELSLTNLPRKMERKIRWAMWLALSCAASQRIVCHFAQFLRTVQTVLRIGKNTLAQS